MKRHLTLILSLCSSLLVFLLSLFQWDLDDRIGKYVSPYIWLFFVIPCHSFLFTTNAVDRNLSV